MIRYQKIFFGSECDNACLGCPVRDRENRIDYPDLLAEVDALSDPESLELCGGEPLLHSHLLPFLAHAQDLGARRIKIVTNGRALAQEALLVRLVEAGCRLFEVKINGPRPEIHEAVTGAAGSFHLTMQGLENLVTLSRSERYNDAVYVAARVAVTRVNLEDLQSTVALLVSLNVDRIILSLRDNDLAVTQVAPSVADATKVATLNRIWAVCEGLPPCVMEGSEMHLAELLQPRRAPGKKRKECRGCAYRRICPGPEKDYIRRWGAGEFRSVSNSPYIKDVMNLLEINAGHDE